MRSAANIGSIVINAAAALLGIVGLFVLLDLSQGARGIASVSVYGITLILAYSTSASYHFARGTASGPVFQAADHGAIYALIAGTYTPFAVLALWDRGGPFLLGTVWMLALAGIAVRVFWIRRLHRAAPVFYVLLGWIGVAWAKPFVMALDDRTLALLVFGGLWYTFGAVLVSRSTTEQGDFLWHLCAVAGSACHFAAILGLVGE